MLARKAPADASELPNSPERDMLFNACVNERGGLTVNDLALPPGLEQSLLGQSWDALGHSRAVFGIFYEPVLFSPPAILEPY